MAKISIQRRTNDYRGKKVTKLKKKTNKTNDKQNEKITEKIERLKESLNNELCEDLEKCVDKQQNIDVNELETIEKTLGEKMLTAIERSIAILNDEQRLLNISPAIKEYYEKLGLYLSKYRSGKLPKAIKNITTFANWSELLAIAKPITWSSHAIAMITPIFISKNDADINRYISQVILPKFYEYCSKSNKLPVHFYEALCKCLYKPSSFFKYFFLPVLLNEDTKLHDVVLICSIIQKISYPVPYTAAVIMKLSNYSGYNNKVYYVLTKLLNKNHSIPKITIIHLYKYFCDALQIDNEYVVLFWQSLLAFAQRWKLELTLEEKTNLVLLINKHKTNSIISDIKRELKLNT